MLENIEFKKDDVVVINLSGRGDKDVTQVKEIVESGKNSKEYNLDLLENFEK